MRRFQAALILSLFALTGCETPPSDEVAVRFFNDIAFRGSPGGYPMAGQAILDTDYAKHRMYRWEEELRVELSGEVTAEYRELAEAAVNRMNEVTGHPARVLKDGEDDANFFVEFVDKKNFNVQRTEAVPCYAQDFGDMTITKVEIKISVEDPTFARYCVAHELYHGFGLAHSNLVRSVISRKSNEDRLTFWDELALRTFYDPRLKSGMTRKEAMPIARRIILQELAK